jgi:hypothetical protein
VLYLFIQRTAFDVGPRFGTIRPFVCSSPPKEYIGEEWRFEKVTIRLKGEKNAKFRKTHLF